MSQDKGSEKSGSGAAVKSALATKGYAAYAANEPLKPFNFERREPGPHDVLIDIKYCGLCHSDIHQARNEWNSSSYPIVPGHEITGVVKDVGSKVTRFKVGDNVGVGCMVDSCRECQPCKKGLQQYCTKGMILTYNSVDKTGATTYGGYSNKIVVDENYVLRIPANLSLAAAAPLLCAGITTYSPLHHWHAGPGKEVAVVGLGGLGHMAIKIGAAMSARVTVLSQTMKKKEDALKLGAHEYYATSDASTFEKLAGRFDLIINTVSAQHDWNQYLRTLGLDGTMVIVGLPSEPIPVEAFSLVGNRRSLSGSGIGGIPETQEMLDFCGKHSIVSDIEMIRPDQINEAFERTIRGDVRYRFVIDCQTL